MSEFIEQYTIGFKDGVNGINIKRTESYHDEYLKGYRDGTIAFIEAIGTCRSRLKEPLITDISF